MERIGLEKVLKKIKINKESLKLSFIVDISLINELKKSLSHCYFRFILASFDNNI